MADRLLYLVNNPKVDFIYTGLTILAINTFDLKSLITGLAIGGVLGYFGKKIVLFIYKNVL